MALTINQAEFKRDEKVRTTMSDFAPIWLTNQTFRATEETLYFHLVYVHPLDGFISERFKYDAFNDVLYRMGSRKLTETEALEFQEQPPYLDGDTLSHIKNAPQFRAPRVTNLR